MARTKISRPRPSFRSRPPWRSNLGEIPPNHPPWPILPEVPEPRKYRSGGSLWSFHLGISPRKRPPPPPAHVLVRLTPSVTILARKKLVDPDQFSGPVPPGGPTREKFPQISPHGPFGQKSRNHEKLVPGARYGRFISEFRPEKALAPSCARFGAL